jgi:hypothetical protein
MEGVQAAVNMGAIEVDDSSSTIEQKEPSSQLRIASEHPEAHQGASNDVESVMHDDLLLWNYEEQVSESDPDDGLWQPSSEETSDESEYEENEDGQAQPGPEEEEGPKNLSKITM